MNEITERDYAIRKARDVAKDAASELHYRATQSPIKNDERTARELHDIADDLWRKAERIGA